MEIKQMTGTCTYCGQTMIVHASSQQEADLIAAEECTCDNILKRCRRCADNIDKICGTSAKDNGMDIVTEEVIESLKEIGDLCVYGHVEAASIRLGDSTIVIKRIKDGVAVQRKKTSSIKLEA